MFVGVFRPRKIASRDEDPLLKFTELRGPVAILSYQVILVAVVSQNSFESLRIYPHPMVWPLPGPWSETMVSIPLSAQKNPRNKGFSGFGAPICGFGLADPAPKG